MDKIKSFFEKKKSDRKFKKLGGGHVLSEVSSFKSARPSLGSSGRQDRVEPSSGSKMAGSAALARVEKSSSIADYQQRRSQKLIQAEAKRRLQEEKDELTLAQLGSKCEEVHLDHSRHEDGVFFICPLCHCVSLPKSDMESHLEDCIYVHGAENPLEGCINMINSLVKDGDVSKDCTDTIVKYLQNILQDPSNEKFRNIRIGNKAFQAKVAPIMGSVELLELLGFVKKTMPFQEGTDEFMVLELSCDITPIQAAVVKLQQAGPLRPKLDRRPKLYSPTELKADISFDKIPDSFYNVTLEDVKAVQAERTCDLERLSELRTKAMREKASVKEMRKYKYCFIRARLPGGSVIQGTFGTKEKVSSLMGFVRSCLNDVCDRFKLATSVGEVLDDTDATLEQYRLAPAAVVILQLGKNHCQLSDQELIRFSVF